MIKFKKLAVLIPCHNEEKGIGKVIDSIPLAKLKRNHIQTEIIVIDNNSTDRTVLKARERNVSIVFEAKKGKGHAIRKGFEVISPDTDYVIMLDGDNTYSAKEIPRLLEPLQNNFCDVIIGTRLGGRIHRNSLSFQNRIANWSYTFLTRQFYRANITDVLSGYFAWKYDVVKGLKKHLNSGGFSIEMEMITKTVKLGYSLYSVPITYSPREGESKINALEDGVSILATFFRNLYWRPQKAYAYVEKIEKRPSQSFTRPAIES